MLSFVTIVYTNDAPMLELQARSMARFVDPAQVASIQVIINDVDPVSVARKVERILPAYGPLRDKVVVQDGDDLLLGPECCARRSLADRVLLENRHRLPFIAKGGWHGNNGYRMQQVLKLASARGAASEQMVILDTKNLFLRPVSPADFFDPAGPARLSFLEVTSDYHRNWFAASLEALDVPAGPTARTTTFATPFPVRRSLILGVLEQINARYGSVQALFGSRRRPSEFMLMNAWCRQDPQGYAPWFTPATPLNIGLWPNYDAERLAGLVAQLEDPQALSLGLHNRAVAGMPVPVRDKILQALEQRGICDASTFQRVLDETAHRTG